MAFPILHLQFPDMQQMIDAYKDLIRATAARLDLDPDHLLLTQELLLDDLSIGLLYEGDDDIGDIVYFCTLGQPDEHRQAQVYAGLLEANTFWVGTGGATLAVHPDSRDVLLCGRLPVESTDADHLLRALFAFLHTAIFWQQFVADTLPDESVSPADSIARAV